MRDILGFYRMLRPEQQKAMEGVLEAREMTLESFKLMRKDYSRLKSRVKQIEKKLLTVMEQAGDENYVCKWVGREVESIEKKYKDIEHAIKHYNMAMRSFNAQINSPYLSQFDPQAQYHGPVHSMKSYLSSADHRINEALNAMRITERYFKNIASAFKGHANLMAVQKRRDERLRMNEMKLAQELELNQATTDNPQTTSTQPDTPVNPYEDLNTN